MSDYANYGFDMLDEVKTILHESGLVLSGFVAGLECDCERKLDAIHEVLTWLSAAELNICNAKSRLLDLDKTKPETNVKKGIAGTSHKVKAE